MLWHNYYFTPFSIGLRHPANNPETHETLLRDKGLAFWRQWGEERRTQLSEQPPLAMQRCSILYLDSLLKPDDNIREWKFALQRQSSAVSQTSLTAKFLKTIVTWPGNDWVGPLTLFQRIIRCSSTYIKTTFADMDGLLFCILHSFACRQPFALGELFWQLQPKKIHQQQF